MLSREPSYSCPNPACSKESYCPNKDICPPVVAPIFIYLQMFCTSFFATYFLVQVVTSISVPARVAEVLYPVPDEYLLTQQQSISTDGKPKRRASLIADRITTTENGRANWNVSGLVSLDLFPSDSLTLFLSLIVYSRVTKYNCS